MSRRAKRSGAYACPRPSSGCSARPAPSRRSPANTSTPRPAASTGAGPAGPSCSAATPSSTRTAAGRRSSPRWPRTGSATSRTTHTACTGSRCVVHGAIRTWATSSRVRAIPHRRISASASTRSASHSNLVTADLSIARRYETFASREAHGTSPPYAELTAGVATDPDLLDLLATLPPEKQQPNLFLAGVRFVAGLAGDFAEFRRLALGHRDQVLSTMRARRTQTNEPGRCAALYPLLATLPQPLALLEVGASAGLCLLPDRYRYGYGGGDPDSPVLLAPRVEGRLPRPGRVEVAWRAGIDLNPLDVTDPEDVRWLETLVWPGEGDRLDRLRAAVAIARHDPPRLYRGDLNERLAEVAEQAPGEATLVVFHTAVLGYLDELGRIAFVEQVCRLPGHWIAQEGAGLVPGIAATPLDG